MEPNTIPKMNMDKSDTGCCPKFDPKPWNNAQVEFDNKLFAKGKTWNFLHIPLNMGSMYKRIFKKMEDEKASPKDYYLTLSHDPSLWKGEHLFAVEKDLPGEEMVKLSGIFLTKVFEGPYSNIGKWTKEMEKYVKSKDLKLKKLYFFYTTCPTCLKTYGKNYVVGFAKVN